MMAKNHARSYHNIYFLSTYLVKLLKEKREGIGKSRKQRAEGRRQKKEEARCLGHRGRRVREVEKSKWLTLGSLSLEEERLGELGFAANLERPEVLVPITLRNFGLRFYPKAQLIKVGEADGAVAHAIH